MGQVQIPHMEGSIYETDMSGNLSDTNKYLSSEFG